MKMTITKWIRRRRTKEVQGISSAAADAVNDDDGRRGG